MIVQQRPHISMLNPQERKKSSQLGNLITLAVTLIEAAPVTLDFPSMASNWIWKGSCLQLNVAIVFALRIANCGPRSLFKSAHGQKLHLSVFLLQPQLYYFASMSNRKATLYGPFILSSIDRPFTMASLSCCTMYILKILLDWNRPVLRSSQ